MEHHYVPQCYLRGFLGKNKKIFRRPLNLPYTPKNRELSTAQIAYQKDFYRLETEWNGSILSDDPYALETKLNKEFESSFESQLQWLLRLITSPSFNERYCFAETILHLKRRNMYFRRNVYTESNLAEVAKTTLDKFKREDQSTLRLFAELEGINSDQVLLIAEKIVAELTLEKNYLKNMHNFSLFKRGSDSPVIGRVCNYIAAADWTILKTDLLKPFVTSDNPGFLIDPMGRIKNMGFEGKFRYYLPLNSENALLIARCDATNFGSYQIQWASATLVDMINTGTLLMANNEIFGRKSEVLQDVSSSPLMLNGL
jgi:hypothetical protein